MDAWWCLALFPLMFFIAVGFVECLISHLLDRWFVLFDGILKLLDTMMFVSTLWKYA
jgi:hypothetical protein